MTQKQFNPTDWYWFIGGDNTKTYSSKVGDYVSINSPEFITWSQDGSLPTNIDTEANLGGVLAPYYPTVTRPVPVAILNGYQQAQSDDVFQHKLVKLLFQMMNDIRVLKGQSALTPAQARAYVKGLM